MFWGKDGGQKPEQYDTYCNLLCRRNRGAHVTFHWTPRTLEFGVASVCPSVNRISSGVVFISTSKKIITASTLFL